MESPWNAGNLKNIFGSRRSSQSKAAADFEVVSPTIVYELNDNKMYVVGQVAVRQFLNDLAKGETPYRGAMSTIGAIYLLVLASQLFSPALAYLGAIWAILGLAVTGFSFPFCNTCGGTDKAIELAKIFLLIAYFLFAALTFRQTSPSHSLFYWMIIAIGIICILVQFGMLVSSPKFCIPCLAGTACICGIVSTSTAILTDVRKRLLLLNKVGIQLTAFAAIAISGFTVKNALVTPQPGKKASESTFLGKRLDDFGIPNSRVTDAILVTIKGCEACVQAKEYLTKNNIKFAEIPTCGLFNSRDCFYCDSSFPAPMLLLTTSSGKISFVHFGWGQDSDYNRKLLLEMQRISGGKQ